MKLQTKLLLLVVPLIVAPLLVLGSIAYVQLQDTSRERMLNELSTVLDQVGRNVAAEFKTARANVELFGTSALVEKYVLTEDEGERYSILLPTLLEEFVGFQRAYPIYKEIRIILPDGYEDARSVNGPIANVTEEEAATDYFQALQRFDGDVYTTMFRNPDDGTASVLVAKPLRLVDRSIDPVLARPILRGYLAITLDLTFIQSLVASHKVGTRGRIFVVDDTGQVLFDPVADHRGRRLRSDLFDALRHAAENEVLLATNDMGQDAVFRAATLEPGLLLVGQLPESDILAASRRLSATVAGIIAAAIAMTAFLTIVALKRLLVRPILELGRAAGEIGAGNLRARARIETKDELGQLANAFSEMGANLDQAQAELHRAKEKAEAASVAKS